MRRLRAFVAVAEEGHVTRAAEKLGMQQPPLSRLIQGLEAELNVRLLHRTRRGVEPTPAGKALLEEARAVLARAEKVEAAVRRAARGEAGRLAIGFTSSAGLHPFVTSVLRQFRETLPGVSLELEEGGTGELVEALVQGRLDAAFVRSSVGRMSAISVETVLDEPMVVTLPTGHRFAANDGALALADLSEEPFILYRRRAGPGLYDAILAACHAAGFSPHVAQEAPRLTATLSLVAAGLGVSIVPASMRRLADDDIAYRALAADCGLSAPLHLAIRRANPPPVLIQFREMMRRILDQ
ncbi:MAG TPA: LysR family transcriptional regulator, partial [Beijerinckiaceae bacterium]|nr:LysR family transcriptional regulator [Beijerinckiaceae bacterium]